MADNFASVDEYVAAQPPDVQRILTEVRRRVADAAPGVTEAISYQIPAFRLDGRYLIYIAAWKHHIAVYPIPEGDEALQRELDPHRSGKGTLKFPLSQPFPFDLVDRLVAAAIAARTTA